MLVFVQHDLICKRYRNLDVVVNVDLGLAVGHCLDENVVIRVVFEIG